ncbi:MULTISPECIES: sugar ABC transporter substrate-binding protein [unclassified Mesorhizobium]|uniref:sugar ABC transporter substrate-binding protein n=1 Tax=unclassified Mesorhizobium TaxID=325217 RepID=UPI00112BA011|nr:MULTISPECIES: sugar ABC transporter substrate-binding protein [unclassified Mesorhizobium]TPL10954.1 sugar ABC transporter substrate-binding protein [Mesorhizobium sp. B2-4-14]UCI31631.1 sugar ABC transporter substrate-binding protein [Mesorhizobium sp. B4-1-4]
MKKILKSIMLGAMIATSAISMAYAKGEKIVFISFAPDSDTWWNVIKNALKETGDEMGVQTTYQNPPTGDLADMVRLIQQATAAHVDGMIVALADYQTLKAPLEAAISAGIPVVTANSGTPEQSKELGALMHVGQAEYDAGHAAGERAKATGAKTFLCVNHYIQNPSSVERCQGFADGMGVALGDQMIDSGIDPGEVKGKVMAYLTKHADTGAIITLGPNSAAPTVEAVKEMGIAGKINFGTFDLSPEITAGIKDGTINYAIDQQPYLQGAVPVFVLTNFIRYGISPANSVKSGPSFVTKDNVEKVEKLAGEYR